MDIGKRLNELRKKRGMTQVEVGEIAGCSTSALSGIERGFRLPSLALLDRIAYALDAELIIDFLGLKFI